MRICFLILAMVFTAGQGLAQRMCITVDDLPTVHYGLNNELEITEGILKSLNTWNVPAIGYVNEGKLYVEGSLDSSRVELLERWLQQEMELGNHTYSHLNYHKATLEEFTDDVIKGELIIKALADKYDKQVRYFRHPYLRSGANKATSDSLKIWLSEHDYEAAPVTIDNEEYLFAKAYAVALRKENGELAEKVGNAYLNYMRDQVEYYEQASNELLGRNMDHILLIHANYLNAMYLDKLLAMLKEKGYSFISQSEALKDSAYQMEVTRFDDWGISWIHRWALSQGMKGDFFKGEAVVPDFVRQLAN